MTSVALITLHGMGETKNEYYIPLVERLIERLGENIWNSKVFFRPVYYQDILQNNQTRVWERMNQLYSLQWDTLRRFMLYGFSDAATLEYSARQSDGIYIRVQERIKEIFEDAFDHLVSQRRPIIVVAQSLGCQVFSNYVWDSQHQKGIFAQTNWSDLDKDEFMKLKTVRYLITTGCNIPVFVAGLDRPRCFEKPNPYFQWHNYFDPDDPLGWPLIPLDQSYQDCGIQEHAVEVGGILTSTPFSHAAYWKNDHIIREISRRISAQILG